MARRVPTAELAQREYWTPGEAARVLGRGRDFWVTAFCQGHIEGYEDGTGARTRRFLQADSARAYLRGLGDRRRKATRGAPIMRAADFRAMIDADPEIQRIRREQAKAAGG